MGNVSSYEADLEGFDPNQPEALPSNFDRVVQRAKETNRLDSSLQNLISAPLLICTLSNVTTVNLSVNKLRYLPIEFFDLVQVTSLDLSCNEFMELPAEIGRLTALSVLQLRHNNLSLLPDSLGVLPALSRLNVESNRLSQLPPLTGGGLSELRLRGNLLSALENPIRLLSDGRSLLDLSENRLSSLGPHFGLAQARTIKLDNNALTSLPASLGDLVELRQLSASSNSITSLPNSLSRLSALSDLDLRANALTALAPDALAGLVQLRKLHVGANRLTSLPGAVLSQLPQLQTLNVSYNALEELPAELSSCAVLKELHAGGNRIRAIPAGLAGVATLMSLTLCWNRITRIDPSVGQFARLALLHINGNGIAELPAELAGLKGLKELYVAANRLTELPQALGELRSLELLDARGNDLFFLPETLHELKFLDVVDVSGNSRVQVPATLGEGRKKPLRVLRGTGLNDARSGFAELRGRRFTQEDASTYVPDLEDGYWAVFDGHGGSETAQEAVSKHPLVLRARLRTVSSKDDDAQVFSALGGSFPALNRELTADLIKKSGSTGVVALLLGSRLFVANVGDARAVLGRRRPSGGRPRFERLSRDHKPGLPSEERRVRTLGGYVSPDLRVFGMLAVSRALGDLELQPYVSAEPHVDVFPVRREEAPFVILGCDGIWDVIDDERAVELVAQELETEGGTVETAAMRLRDVAYCLGSLDNESVIIVNLENIHLSSNSK